MAFVVRRCRELYNAALQERREAWQKCGVSVTDASQSAQLPAVKEVRPEYRDIHSQVLQDVLTRLDRAFQAFFRRVQERARRRAIRASREPTATTASPTSNSATGPRWTMASWSSPRSGALRVRWSRPIEGTPKTVTISAGSGWLVCLLLLCRRAGAALAADGTGDGHRPWAGSVRHALRWHAHLSPRLVSQSRAGDLKTAQRRVSRRKKGSNRRSKAVSAAGQSASEGAAPAAGLPPQDGARTRASSTTRSITRTCRRPTWSRITTSPRASRMRGGSRS